MNKSIFSATEFNKIEALQKNTKKNSYFTVASIIHRIIEKHKHRLSDNK